jgi:mono/diheme cytochrome c family protein
MLTPTFANQEEPMRRTIFAVAASVFTLAAFACATENAESNPVVSQPAPVGEIATKSAPAKGASFAADVMPILKVSCMRCHGNAGDLSLESYGAMMAGAKGEKVVVPGNPEGSTLVKFIDGGKSPRMPLGADPLSAAQINGIRAWIAAGAKND